MKEQAGWITEEAAVGHIQEGLGMPRSVAAQALRREVDSGTVQRTWLEGRIYEPTYARYSEEMLSYWISQRVADVGPPSKGSSRPAVKHFTDKTRGEFIEDYFARKLAAKQQPTKEDCMAKIKAAGYRGQRQANRDAYDEVARKKGIEVRPGRSKARRSRIARPSR
jgi:hypothetical protein